MCPSCAVCLNCAFPKLFLTAPFLVGRYLLCEVIVPDRRHLLLLDDRAVAASVREAVARVHGDYGAALCSSRFSGERWFDLTEVQKYPLGNMPALCLQLHTQRKFNVALTLRKLWKQYKCRWFGCLDLRM